MDLISHGWMIGNTYLKLKLFIRHYTYCLPYKVIRKVKDLEKTSANKEIYFTLQSSK